MENRSRAGTAHANLTRRLPLLLVALVATACLTNQRASALSADQAQQNCRAAIGRPIVRACIQDNMQSHGGFPQQYLQGCRTLATPAVRSCFQSAMKDVIAACRKSVGRPIVEACVQSRVANEGRFRFEQIEDCRKNAFSAVRACVWKTSAVTE